MKMFCSFLTGTFFIWVVILPCTGRPIDERKLNEKVSEFRNILAKFSNGSISEKKKIQLEVNLEMKYEQAVRNELENDEKYLLQRDKNIILNCTNEKILLNLWRLLIDDYEESFPQPYEDDFENTRVKYDQGKLKNLIEYDLIEERRRQRWLYYCQKPPNKKMTDLVSSLNKEKVDCDTFSRGIAKAFRLVSDKFHSGFYEVMVGDPKKYFMFKSVVIAMRILLKQEDILDELIISVPDPLKKDG